MKMWKFILPVAAVLLLAGQAAAQTDEAERQRAMDAREAEMEKRLFEAEKKMSEAAREIAEITKERLPRIMEIEQRFALASKPRLGVTIESLEKSGPVEGVTILGVSPGSAASDAGLRSGDILTAVNEETLSADSCLKSNKQLLKFMKGVEEGDILSVEYLRDGKSGSVEVEPRLVAMAYSRGRAKADPAVLLCLQCRLRPRWLNVSRWSLVSRGQELASVTSNLLS